MKILDRLFEKKCNNKKPTEPKVNNQTLHLSTELAQQKKSSLSEESVRNIVRGDPLNDVFLELKYIADHPCSCSGQWQRIGGGSAFPHYVNSNCKCVKCGAEKIFIFYF